MRGRELFAVVGLVVALGACGGSDGTVRSVGATPDPEPTARIQVEPGPTPGTHRVEAHGYEPESEVAVLVCLAGDLPGRLAAHRTAFDEGAACDQDAATVTVADADGSVLEPALVLQPVLHLPRGVVDCRVRDGGCAVVTAAVASRDRIAWQPVELGVPGT